MAVFAIVAGSRLCCSASDPAFMFWREQSRNEPWWITPSESARYRGMPPTRDIPYDTTSWKGLDPFFAGRVERAFLAAKAAGLEPIFFSGFRPEWYQNKLSSDYRDGNVSGIQFKPSKRSYHTTGVAVDIQILNVEKMETWVRIIHGQGLSFTVPNDPNHIEQVAIGWSSICKTDWEPLALAELFDPAGGILRRIDAHPNANEVTVRLTREYNMRAEQLRRQEMIRAETRRFLERSVRELDAMRTLEKPEPFKYQREPRESVFGNKYEFDDPFGNAESRPHELDGIFGNWKFDEPSAEPNTDK